MKKTIKLLLSILCTIVIVAFSVMLVYLFRESAKGLFANANNYKNHIHSQRIIKAEAITVSFFAFVAGITAILAIIRLFVKNRIFTIIASCFSAGTVLSYCLTALRPKIIYLFHVKCDYGLPLSYKIAYNIIPIVAMLVVLAEVIFLVLRFNAFKRSNWLYPAVKFTKVTALIFAVVFISMTCYSQLNMQRHPLTIDYPIVKSAFDPDNAVLFLPIVFGVAGLILSVINIFKKNLAVSVISAVTFILSAVHFWLLDIDYGVWDVLLEQRSLFWSMKYASEIIKTTAIVIITVELLFLIPEIVIYIIQKSKSKAQVVNIE